MKKELHCETLVEYQIVKCRNNTYKINCYKVGLQYRILFFF